MSETQYKTPAYIRKSVLAYYERVKDDPEKYSQYVAKRSSYQKSYYHKKMVKKFTNLLENTNDENQITLYENKIQYHTDKYEEYEKTRKSNL